MSNLEFINTINESSTKLKNSVNGTTRRLVKEISKDDFKNSNELKDMFSYYCSSVLTRKIKNCENWGRIFIEEVDAENNYGRPLNFYYEFVCPDGLKLINKLETSSSIHCGGFQKINVLPIDTWTLENDTPTRHNNENEYVMCMDKFKFADMDEPQRITKGREGREFIINNLPHTFVTDM
jgi:hypothetical protein